MSTLDYTVLILGGMAATVTLIAMMVGLADRRNLRRSGKNGALKMVADHGVMREWLRSAKCIILYGVMALTIFKVKLPWPPMDMRNLAVDAVLLLMAITSAADLVHRHRLIKYILRTKD